MFDVGERPLSLITHSLVVELAIDTSQSVPFGSFEAHLAHMRTEVTQRSIASHDAIIFYDHANELFIHAMTISITYIDIERIWKDLIAYKMIRRAKENLGISIAVGMEHFLTGQCCYCIFRFHWCDVTYHQQLDNLLTRFLG